MVNECNVGWCPLCDQGWITVVKSILTSNLYLCCRECDTEWKNPYKLEAEHCLPFNTYGRYEFPTKDEIINYGWSEFLK